MNNKIYKVGLLGFLGLFLSGATPEMESEWQTVRSMTSVVAEDAAGLSAFKVRIESASDEKVVLRYNLPAPVVERDGAKDSVRLGPAPLRSVAGEPRVPFLTVQLIVPPGRRVSSASMITDGFEEVPGEFEIEPAGTPFARVPGATVPVTRRDPAVYEVDGWFPTLDVEVVGTHLSRGIPVFIANLYPVRYHPKTGKVGFTRTFTLEVELAPDAASGSNLPCRTSSLFPVREWVENPGALEKYRDMCETADRADPHMVIVTSEAIAGDDDTFSISAFQTYKNDQGIASVIETMENIKSTYSGVDDAEKLRNYIIEKYEQWGIEYVLLVGDCEVVPERQLYVVGNDPDSPGEPYIDNMPSDVYFGCLDGSYNEDGDNQWGEPDDGAGGSDVDLMFEVFVGRAPADTPGQVASWVEKTTAFENEEPDGAFRRSHLMAGEHLGFGGPSEYAMDMLEQIVHGSDFGGMVTAGFDADPSYTTDTMYQAESNWDGMDMWNAMNGGTYAWFNHLGHAYTDTVMQLGGGSVMSLSNDKPFFIYSQGCYAGAFDADDSMAEYFTTTASAGAFAVVFNARYGFGLGDSLDGPSNRYHRQFWDAVFGEDMTCMGQIHADQKQDLVAMIDQDVMRWVFYQTNYFGDPSLDILADGGDIGPDADSDTDTETDTDPGAEEPEDDGCGCNAVGQNYESRYSLLEELIQIFA